MKVLIVTNLFGYPWDPTRGMFNQQQFDRLAQRVELSVLVAVPWPEALRRPRAYWSAVRDGRRRWPYVDYFVFWYPPGLVQSWHSVFFFLSMLVQRPVRLLCGGWRVLVGSWGFPDAVATRWLGALTSTPALMKLHGSDVNVYLDSPGKRRQILAAAARCAAVMCPSEALRERLVGAGVDARRVHVIYNGVDTARFRPADRAAARDLLGQPHDARVILFVGNLKQAKGCLDLVDAFVQVANQDSFSRLVVVGDGDQREEMRSRADRAGMQGRVTLAGKVEHERLRQYLAAADLLCLPSHNEGLPNVVLESMACGIPVVATRVGGIPEIVPDFAGLLVEPREVAALGQALREALVRRWDAGRIVEWAGRFSWERNVASVIELLDARAAPAAAKERGA